MAIRILVFLGAASEGIVMTPDAMLLFWAEKILSFSSSKSLSPLKSTQTFQYSFRALPEKPGVSFIVFL